jgi:hypothetical protein
MVMKMKNLKGFLVPAQAVVMLIILASVPASAAIVTYTAVLTGDNEVPPVATAAAGIATLTFDDSNGFVNSIPLHLEFAGLSGAQNAVHIHEAPAGANGPALFALPLGSPVDIQVPLGQLPVASLEAGNLYVNVHTTSFPSGEIRGQFLRSGSVEAEAASWGSIKAVYR